MVVTFCGHNGMLNNSVDKKLEEALRSVLCEDPAAVFYLGGYGSFDNLCNEELKKLQEEFPLLRRIYVSPYLDPENSRLQKAKLFYDESLYPFTDRVLPKYAIIKRNQWMVDKADLLIAYVEHSWGGATMTLEYAIKRHKKRLRFAGAFVLLGINQPAFKAEHVIRRHAEERTDRRYVAERRLVLSPLDVRNFPLSHAGKRAELRLI